MTAKITLTWDNGSSEHVDQIVYRSAESFTSSNLPPVLARVGRNAREYTDTDIVTGNVYFYAVASENAVGEILLSSVISVTAEVSTGDPHWDNVVALLHFDGDFTDETGRLWTQTGEFLTSADNKVFGTESAYFPPTGLRGLQTPSTPDLNIGSNDFTVECWINPRIRSRQINICGLYGWSFERRSWDFLFQDGYLIFRISPDGSWNTTRVAEASMGSNMLNRWTHLAVTREGNVFRMFFDGVVVSQKTYNISARENLVDPFVFGTTGPDFINSWDGYIDELRITKGVARYTENFTPPTEPFPNF